MIFLAMCPILLKFYELVISYKIPISYIKAKARLLMISEMLENNLT